MAESAIIARVLATALDVDAAAWNTLLAQQSHPTPFMRHEYLAALETSDSATPRTGWAPRFMTLWEGDTLIAACPLYLKNHSYGEYMWLCSISWCVQPTLPQAPYGSSPKRASSDESTNLDTFRCPYAYPAQDCRTRARLLHRD